MTSGKVLTWWNTIELLAHSYNNADGIPYVPINKTIISDSLLLKPKVIGGYHFELVHEIEILMHLKNL